MADVRRFILTDVEDGIWKDEWELGPSDLGMSTAIRWWVRKRRLHGGLRDGVDVIEVCNGPLRFTVIPSRGMGIWRGAYGDMELGWQSPARGPVNPAFVNLPERGGLGWLAGFNEWVVRCGLSSNGAPTTDVVPDNNGNPCEIDLPLHGRIANTPAHHVEVCVLPSDPPKLVIGGAVDEASLFGPILRLRTAISTPVGSNRLDIADDVINIGASKQEFELLYHINYGAPLLQAGSCFEAPVTEVAPRDDRAAEDIETWDLYGPPAAGFVEQCYWHRMKAGADGRTVALLRTADGDLGSAVRYPPSELPCFAQWKNTAAMEEGYVTGLEPATNLPNAKPFERRCGRVPSLGPGEMHSVRLSIEALDSREAVKGVQKEIRGIAGGAAPKVHLSPVAKWSDLGA